MTKYQQQKMLFRKYSYLIIISSIFYTLLKIIYNLKTLILWPFRGKLTQQSFRQLNHYNVQTSRYLSSQIIKFSLKINTYRKIIIHKPCTCRYECKKRYCLPQRDSTSWPLRRRWCRRCCILPTASAWLVRYRAGCTWRWRQVLVRTETKYTLLLLENTQLVKFLL